MQTIELTAKSVEEAKKLASAKLGVSEDQIEVSVLEESKGLFGKSSLKVRAETKAASAPSHVDGGQSAPLEEIQEAYEEKPKETKGRSRAKKKPEPEKESAPAETPEPESAVPEADIEEGSGEQAPDVVASQEDAERFEKLMTELLEAADLSVTAKAAPQGGRYVNIVLDGKDVGHLVGKHGEVLNAMQYLVNIIASRRFANGVRATLDGNDFRKRREEALLKLATSIAKEVQQRQEEAVLDALPAFERRIVHRSLQGYPGVKTYSEGVEPNRRVVIAPAE